MKQCLPLFFLMLLFSTQSQSQTCIPNAEIVDSSAFVLPVPYDAATMTGGITDTACINTYYETSFTFLVPETLTFGGFLIGIDSLELDPGNPDAVKGLPEGLSYTCNRPDCKFISTQDSAGCALIFGTPTSNNTPGDYPLEITIRAFTAVGPQTITFPNSDIPNADGEYIISLQPEGSANCSLVNTEELYKSQFSIEASPNPFSYYTQINVDAKRSGDLQLMVFNVLGRRVYDQNIQVVEGRNNFEFDATNLPTGMYLYAITDGEHVITKKMMVSR